MSVDDLCQAAAEGDMKIVESLVEQNADIDCLDRFGLSALHWAARDGHDNIVQLLLTQDANVYMENKREATPLQTAARRGGVSTLKLLLDWNAEINHQNKGGYTALHSACYHADVLDNAEFLLQSKANPDLEADDGKLPIDLLYNKHKRKYSILVRFHRQSILQKKEVKTRKASKEEEEATKKKPAALQTQLSEKNAQLKQMEEKQKTTDELPAQNQGAHEAQLTELGKRHSREVGSLNVQAAALRARLSEKNAQLKQMEEKQKTSEELLAKNQEAHEAQLAELGKQHSQEVGSLKAQAAGLQTQLDDANKNLSEKTIRLKQMEEEQKTTKELLSQNKDAHEAQLVELGEQHSQDVESLKTQATTLQTQLYDTNTNLTEKVAQLDQMEEKQKTTEELLSQNKHAHAIQLAELREQRIHGMESIKTRAATLQIQLDNASTNLSEIVTQLEQVDEKQKDAHEAQLVELGEQHNEDTTSLKTQNEDDGEVADDDGENDEVMRQADGIDNIDGDSAKPASSPKKPAERDLKKRPRSKGDDNHRPSKKRLHCAMAEDPGMKTFDAPLAEIDGEIYKAENSNSSSSSSPHSSSSSHSSSSGADLLQAQCTSSDGRVLKVGSTVRVKKELTDDRPRIFARTEEIRKIYTEYIEDASPDELSSLQERFCMQRTLYNMKPTRNGQRRVKLTKKGSPILENYIPLLTLYSQALDEGNSLLSVKYLKLLELYTERQAHLDWWPWVPYFEKGRYDRVVIRDDKECVDLTPDDSSNVPENFVLPKKTSLIKPEQY